MESVNTVLLNIIYLYLKILKIYLMFTLLNIILYYLKNISSTKFESNNFSMGLSRLFQLRL